MLEANEVRFFAFGVVVYRHECLSLIPTFIGAICVSVAVTPTVRLAIPVALNHRCPYLARGVMASYPTITIACGVFILHKITRRQRKRAGNNNCLEKTFIQRNTSLKRSQ